jgi:ribosome-binding ATPase YchF (GTP1/OBG family)
MEAIAVVLRAFEDDTVPEGDSGTDPVAQAETILLELALADSEVFSRRSEKAAKEAGADPSKRVMAESIAAAAAVLEDGTALRSEEWDDQALASFRDLAPLTLKPALWVVNVGEDEPDTASLVASVSAVVPEGDTVVALSARIEEEGARLDPEERAELFEGLGLGEGALATIVAAGHGALRLLSFFTLNEKEAHAWTVRRGATAREAAGKVHSDMERGFIRAEIASIDDVVAAGGWDAAKAAGLVHVEGKEHEVSDGDVLLVRFSV